MLKQILHYSNPLNWIFSRKRYFSRIRKNAFHTSNPAIRRNLENDKVVEIVNTALTEKELVEDEFSSINWSRVSLEGKKQLISIAKSDINDQINKNIFKHLSSIN